MENILQKYCSDEWCKYVEHYSREIPVKKGQPVFVSGEEVRGLYILNSGFVKVAAGCKSVRIIRLAGPNEIIGHRGFGGDWRYTVTAVALTNCSLKYVPLDVFNAVFKGNPDFAYFIMSFFAEELKESEGFSLNLPVKNSVARALYKNALSFGFKKDSSTLNFTLSRSDLASFAATRYETVIRTLQELVNDKIIELNKKEISIVDFDGLKQLAMPA